jgi:Formamidopyrimidine-DNA glycosylase
MPEGDTLYRIAVNLRKALLGRRVTRFESRVEQVAAVNARRPVAGRTVLTVDARGKHLLIVFRKDEPSEVAKTPVSLGLELQRDDLVLHTHLRMTGSWHIYRPGERWQKPERQAVVTIYTEDFATPCFSAPVVELLTAIETARHPDLTTIGPDAMTEDFDSLTARARIRQRPDLPIGVALMHQRLIAGVGNVFKSEVLFLQRISPFVKVGDLTDETLDRVIGEAHQLMRLNADNSGRRTMFTLDERKKLWVYGRSGKPCRVCGENIRMQRQGIDGRSTYYCPRCQDVTE